MSDVEAQSPSTTPAIFSGDQWEQAQYAPHRAGQDGEDPTGPGRILTGEEWEKAKAAASVTQVKLPPLPKIAAAPRDVTRTPADTKTKGTPLAPFDIKDPMTYANPILRQLVNPTLEHPVEGAAMLAAIPLAPVIAGAGTAAAIATTAAGAAVGGSMVYHIAQYGWQKAAELSLSPEDRARAEADPDRISGEAAAMQAAMLGLAPLIHVGMKGLTPSFEGASAPGLGGFAERMSPPRVNEGAANSRFAADLEQGAATARIPADVDRPPGFEPTATGARLKTNPRKVEGLEGPTVATPGRGKPIATQDAAGAVAEDAAGRQQVIEDAKDAAEIRQEELTRQEALRALTGVRRRPGGVAPTVEEARQADADRVTQQDHPQAGSSQTAPYFESPQGAEVLGMMAARHGLPDDAVPYHPDSPLAEAWKSGHDASSQSYPLHPDGFSMGGALTDNRIPGDYSPAKLPRTERPAGFESTAIPDGATTENAALASALKPSRFRGHSVDELVQVARSARETLERSQQEIDSGTAHTVRDANGSLRRNLGAVSSDELEAELHKLSEQNATEEAQHAAVQDAGYRASYEELPRTERLGRKGREDLPDADGQVDSERLLADNKTVAEFRRTQVVRDARAKAIERIQAELSSREDTSFNFGENATDGSRGAPMTDAERDAIRAKGTLTQVEREFALRGITGDALAKRINPGEAPAPDITPAPSEPYGKLTPVEGTGETRTRGLSAGVEAKALVNKLETTVGDLPEYRTVNMADQATRASSLLETDPALARRVALGEVQAPNGLLPESVFVAVENKAIAEGDVATLRDLASGGLTTEATTMGQRIRALGERDPDSPVAAIQQVVDARSGGAKRAPAAVSDAVESLRTHIEQASGISESAWKTFVDSLRC